MLEIRGQNEHTHLILSLNYQLSKYVDITAEVFYIKEEANAWFVGYASNSKYYYVSFKKLKVSQNPKIVTYNEVFINKKKAKVFEIIFFDGLGYKLFLENRTIYVPSLTIKNGRVDVTILPHNPTTGSRLLDYYKNLASYAAEIAESDDAIENVIDNLYRRVNFINPESVFAEYERVNGGNAISDNHEFIYPYSTNESQMNAVENAFTKQMSVISGPPGTGKTQVILNIICNAIIRGERIAVVSNNNTAVDNVYSKMQEDKLDYLLAFLGNSENVSNFFSHDDQLQAYVDEYTDNKPFKLKDIIKKIKDLYNKSNQLALLRTQRFELNKEYSAFIANHSIQDFSGCFRKNAYLDSSYCMKLKFYLLSMKKIGFFSKLALKFKYKLLNIKETEIEEFIDYLDKAYYEEKLFELSIEIEKIETYLKDNNLECLNKELKEKSRINLHSYLKKKYTTFLKENKVQLSIENYRKKFFAFIERYPVILSTTHSLLRNIGSDFLFDLVIIDEASQSDLLSSILTLNFTKRIVVVGDQKQLSQIDNQSIYDASKIYAKELLIAQAFQYKDNSLLDSFSNFSKNITISMLREHYRCDARIIGFCNKKFYENQLIICTNTKDDDPFLVVHTVPGNHARKNPNGSGVYNIREAEEIQRIVESTSEQDIGVITPFRAQADYISSQLHDKYPYVEIDTIHKYQGRQKKIVILSTVVNDIGEKNNEFLTDFVTNSQLLNVAVSRAIDKLYLIVSDKVYQSKNNAIAQLIDYIKYYSNNNVTEQGKIVSVFDKLYQKQNEVEKTSACAKFVDSYAEELMLKEINKILVYKPEYQLRLHYRLKDLLSTYDGFTSEEVRYITHPKTHVDFVIFDKISYRPVICIEVDGTKYHDYSKVQVEHDVIKTRILEANQIPILRLKTNGSNEIEKIEEYL